MTLIEAINARKHLIKALEHLRASGLPMGLAFDVMEEELGVLESYEVVRSNAQN